MKKLFIILFVAISFSLYPLLSHATEPWVYRYATHQYGNTVVYHTGIPILDSLYRVRHPLETQCDMNDRTQRKFARIIRHSLTKSEKEFFIEHDPSVKIVFTVSSENNRSCEIAFVFFYTDKPHDILSLSTIEKLHKRLMGRQVISSEHTLNDYYHSDIYITPRLIENRPIKF